MAFQGARIVEDTLKRRADLVTMAARGTSLAVAALALFLLWDSPTTRPGAALAVGVGYAAYALASWLWARRRPEWRPLAKVLHDVVDALAVGTVAALSGGLASPIFLLLYPHVVAVSARGGLRYAMAVGSLDAALVFILARMGPPQSLGELHAPAMLFCAFLAGNTSSYLRLVRARLGEANRELQAKNEQLALLVSQAREANERLSGLHRLRAEYLRNVSHEFRSPLTVIRGYAEYVADQGVPADSTLPEVMRVVMQSCDQMIDMVDTLLEVSRIEQGDAGRKLDIRPVAVREVLDTALASVRMLAEKKEVRIDIALPPEPFEVAADLALLAHAVRHLLSNALKYGPSRGTVSVRGRADDAHVVVEVQDQGIGIAPEHLPHIFDKFYVADGGLNRRGGGAGVGLYLAREIVRLHQGSIEVASRPGEGAVFTITMPRSPALVASAATA